VNVCVYCASSDRVDSRFHDAATELGEWIAAGRHTLVYGGGSVGLMGTLARAVHARHGKVAGYIPRRLQEIEGRAYDIADELVVTETMSERKRGMYTRADAFVILPGGIGTLEEFFEVLTLRKLGYHAKPIVVVNLLNFFDPLLALLRHVDQQEMSPGIMEDGSFVAVTSVAEVFEVLAK